MEYRQYISNFDNIFHIPYYTKDEVNLINEGALELAPFMITDDYGTLVSADQTPHQLINSQYDSTIDNYLLSTIGPKVTKESFIDSMDTRIITYLVDDLYNIYAYRSMDRCFWLVQKGPWGFKDNRKFKEVFNFIEAMNPCFLVD